MPLLNKFLVESFQAKFISCPDRIERKRRKDFDTMEALKKTDSYHESRAQKKRSQKKKMADPVAAKV